MLKNAQNQADNIAIFQSCLLLKMRLSVVLEGGYTGYQYYEITTHICFLFIFSRCVVSTQASGFSKSREKVCKIEQDT